MPLSLYPQKPALPLLPDPDANGLSVTVSGQSYQEGNLVNAPIVNERPLTLYLNSQEIVTMMTIGDHPDLLALGYYAESGHAAP